MAFSLGQLRASAAKGPPDGALERRRTPRSRWQFKLFHKLALIVALSFLPAVILGYLLIAEGRKDTVAAERERQGIAYLGIGMGSFAGERDRAGSGDGLGASTSPAALTMPIFGTATSRVVMANAARQGGAVAAAASREFIQRITDNSGLSVDGDLSTLQAITIFTSRMPDLAAAAALATVTVMKGDGPESDGAVGLFQRLSRQLSANLVRLTRSTSKPTSPSNWAATRVRSKRRPPPSSEP